MSNKPPLTRNQRYINLNSGNLSLSNVDTTNNVNMMKPKLTRKQRYITPNSGNVSLSNVDTTNNIVNNMIIEINGEKYGLYKLHTPTRRNGGKRHNKKRHTRKH